MGRRYGLRRPWVLRGVALDLPPGALVRIEGRNGGGKSTWLRLVAGIDTPTEGRITGRPPRTAYVPERFPAALPLTATAYLIHMGRVHGLARGGGPGCRVAGAVRGRRVRAHSPGRTLQGEQSEGGRRPGPARRTRAARPRRGGTSQR